MNHPAGINIINDNGFWYAFVTNALSHTLTRLDFGSSLTNTPSGVNLGNPGNILNDPRGIRILKYCSDSIMGFVTNGEFAPALVRLNFNAGLVSMPTATNLGNLGNLNFPHSITVPQRIGSDLYFFVTNVYNNTITRFKIAGQCSNVDIPSSTNATPPTFIYSKPGTYTINLTVDDGLPTQTSFCKQIVIIPRLSVDVNFSQDVCNPKLIQFNTNNNETLNWDLGNGTLVSNNKTPLELYSNYGIYSVKLKASALNTCADSVTKQIPIKVFIDSAIITRDTAVCYSGDFQLNALPGVNYCWTPSTGLNATIHEFSIYNRWGQRIFTTKDPTVCWDGTFKGKPQDSGEFVYIIKALTACGEVERKGTVMLIR